MTDLLVVADDLTGATDTGVQFARGGATVRVRMEGGRALDEAELRASVLVVDTESRHLEAGEAARRMEAVVRWGREAGIAHFFKKTDSTLRGNLGAELEALRAASGCAHLAFVPALPALGRTTRGGTQYLHGRPLHETDFARDPLEPITESSVAELLRRQASGPVLSLAVAALRGSSTPPLPESGILVFDAESDEDITAIVEWLRRRKLLGAVAGTAALARALAGSAPWGGEAAPLPAAAAVGPMLVVGGSLNPVSLAQLDHAAAAGMETVLLPAAALLEAGEAEAAGAVAEALAHLRGGRSVLLRSARGPADVEACRARGVELGLPAGELHPRIAGGTGAIVRAILAAHRVEVLTVFGGDTLAGILRALERPALLPRWEALPGIPVSELEGAGGMLIVSKAGGFGARDVVTRIGSVMREGRIG